jgi:hypothetical protein
VVFLREVLATVDKPLTIVLEPLGEGKIHVRTSSWHQAVVISADEVLEAVGGRQVASADPGATSAGASRGQAERICRCRVRLLRQWSHCDAYGVTRCVTM